MSPEVLRTRLQIAAGWALTLPVVVLAWRWWDDGGLRGGLAQVVASLGLAGVLLVVLAVVRDLWTDHLCGSPEAPQCPDWATARQQKIWRVLHAIDDLAPPAPRLARSRR